MKEFLSHYIDEQVGEVLNEQGETIGQHNGSLFYTIGERHGFIIDRKGTDDKPYYIIAKDLQVNTITVSQKPQEQAKSQREYTLESVIDNQGILKSGMKIESQIRYRGKVKKMTIISFAENLLTMKITFDESDATIAAGQSVVFYNGDVCLGGGIIA